MNMRLCVFLGLGLATVALAADPPLTPDPGLTPGVVLTTDTAKICAPGYARSVRAVSDETKARVFADYRIDPKSGHFEIDHLISLELGGSNDIGNLWPQSYETKPYNAHLKDRLEDHLHALVCKGEVPLEQAQHDIATDWIGAIAKYGVKP